MNRAKEERIGFKVYKELLGEFKDLLLEKLSANLYFNNPLWLCSKSAG
ncbi:MAG: hypothetical protein ACOYU0_09185 [Nitrospirota bacterium]